MRQAIFRVSSLVGSPVISTPHRSLNSSKGTVYAVDFVSWKEEEILRELQTDGVPVSREHRFLDSQGCSPVDSSRFLLTFDIPHLLSHVYLGIVLAAVSVAIFFVIRVGRVDV